MKDPPATTHVPLHAPDEAAELALDCDDVPFELEAEALELAPAPDPDVDADDEV